MKKLAIFALTLTFAVAVLAIVVARRERTDVRALVEAVRAGRISRVTSEYCRRRVNILDAEMIEYLFLRADEAREEDTGTMATAYFYGQWGSRWTVYLRFDNDRIYVGRTSDEDIEHDTWYRRMIPLTKPIPKWVNEAEQFLDPRNCDDGNVLNVHYGGVTDYTWE
jgi:hypothetical protein